MQKYSGIGRIGEMLNGLAGHKKWRTRLAQHTLFLDWEELVGPEIAAVARPEVVRDSVLWVRVVDQVWCQQLQYEQNTLLETINHRLAPEQRIAAIRLRMDPGLDGELLAEGVGPQGLEPKPASGLMRSAPLDPAKEAEFKKMIGGLSDPEARANLLRLWRKSQGG